VNVPPRIGPSTLDSPYTAPISPINPGRIFGSAANATMTKAPVATPAAPIPEIARQITKVVEFGETAQIRLPTMKMMVVPKKEALSGKYLNSFPDAGWNPP
jgi:hypothetical protein